MCMAYYIAADTEIPLLSWDETSPGLFVQELQPDVDTSVTGHFSKTCIRYVGSHHMKDADAVSVAVKIGLTMKTKNRMRMR